MNRKKSKNKCVFLIKRNGKPYRYMVRTYINKERRYVGCFKTEDEAVNAYNNFLHREQLKMLKMMEG
jgi:hypothetical protein